MSDEIDRILSATDHYQVLNVDRNVDAANLRKAYLKCSVQVHPDKNTDPRATTAFQKVALAWQVLSDDNERMKYDNASRSDFASGFNGGGTNKFNSSSTAGSSNYGGYQQGGYQQGGYQQGGYQQGGYQQGGGGGGGSTSYAPPPQPSFQDAMFMFATVTSMMGGKTSVASDIAQTLFWAEKIVQSHQEQQQKSRASGCNNNNNNDQNIDLKTHASIAMALSSSLRVASAAANVLGFKEAGKSLNKTANMAQVVGMGAMVADATKDTPGMRSILEQGSKIINNQKNESMSRPNR